MMFPAGACSFAAVLAVDTREISGLPSLDGWPAELAPPPKNDRFFSAGWGCGGPQGCAIL